ncbi:MAG: hypothetical protein MZV63_53815 [Marinilabiliales bacterium]|nr:hypothetical protein [Marinilabiliales bacterium]
MQECSTVALGVNLYYMHYRDQLVPTGRISNTGYPIMTNVPESYRTGVELVRKLQAFAGGWR